MGAPAPRPGVVVVVRTAARDRQAPTQDRSGSRSGAVFEGCRPSGLSGAASEARVRDPTDTILLLLFIIIYRYFYLIIVRDRF